MLVGAIESTLTMQSLRQIPLPECSPHSIVEIEATVPFDTFSAGVASAPAPALTFCAKLNAENLNLVQRWKQRVRAPFLVKVRPRVDSRLVARRALETACVVVSDDLRPLGMQRAKVIHRLFG
jgi:hypothetical protein